MKNRIIFLILILGLLFISGCINSQPKKIKKNYTENDLDNMLENVRKLLSLPTCYEMVGERFKKEDNNDLPHDE